MAKALKGQCARGAARLVGVVLRCCHERARARPHRPQACLRLASCTRSRPAAALPSARLHLLTAAPVRATAGPRLPQTCNFLGVLVRSKRSTRSSSSLTADECQRELTKISFECLQLEAAEKREQFAASLNFLETTDGLTPAQERERKADIQTYKRQFEQDMMQTNFSHKAAAASNAAEMVPYMMVAQTMNVTEMILNQGPRK